MTVVSIPFTYLVSGVLRRERSFKRHLILDRIEVEVPEFSRTDLDEDVEISIDTRSVPVAVLGGVPFGSFSLASLPISFDGVKPELLGIPRHELLGSTAASCALDRYGHMFPVDLNHPSMQTQARPSEDLRDVEWSDRAERLDDALKDAASLAFVDGELYSSRIVSLVQFSTVHAQDDYVDWVAVRRTDDLSRIDMRLVDVGQREDDVLLLPSTVSRLASILPDLAPALDVVRLSDVARTIEWNYPDLQLYLQRVLGDVCNTLMSWSTRANGRIVPPFGVDFQGQLARSFAVSTGPVPAVSCALGAISGLKEAMDSHVVVDHTPACLLREWTTTLDKASRIGTALFEAERSYVREDDLGALASMTP